jgi:hypothetical protein
MEQQMMEQQTRPQPPGRSVTTKQHWLARLGQECPRRAFSSLLSCIDLKWLQEAYCRTRKTIVIERNTANLYSMNLEVNLQALLERLHSGCYQPPVAQQPTDGHLPADVIAWFEDKLLQQAVAMLLEPLYEQEFLDCSYGRRPGRSAQQALTTLWQQLTDMGGGWVVELSIGSLRDHIDSGQLLQWLSQRVSDESLCRLIEQWIDAGMLKHEQSFFCEIEQHDNGLHIGSILLNLYLHEVLDSWFENNVKKRLQDRSFIIRYKDNAILGFADQADARRVMMVLPKHFGRYRMTLHSGTTRLVRFLPEDRGIEQQPSVRPCHHLVKQLCA